MAQRPRPQINAFGVLVALGLAIVALAFVGLVYQVGGFGGRVVRENAAYALKLPFSTPMPDPQPLPLPNRPLG
jgi:hypothetical protein